MGQTVVRRLPKFLRELSLIYSIARIPKFGPNFFWGGGWDLIGCLSNGPVNCTEEVRAHRIFYLPKLIAINPQRYGGLKKKSKESNKNKT